MNKEKRNTTSTNLAKRIIRGENSHKHQDDDDDTQQKTRSGSFFELSSKKKSDNSPEKGRESLKGVCDMVHCDLPTSTTTASVENSDAQSKPQANSYHTDINHRQQYYHRHDSKETTTLKQRSFSNLSSMHTTKTVDYINGGIGSTYQNTYEVEPTHPFDTKTVRNIVRAELEYLQGLTARHQAKVPSNTDCLKAADSIKTKLKSQGYRRYRYIVNITVADNREQTFRVASRFFWDAERDKYVCQSIRDKHFFLVCVVYAVYFE